MDSPEREGFNEKDTSYVFQERSAGGSEILRCAV